MQHENPDADFRDYVTALYDRLHQLAKDDQTRIYSITEETAVVPNGSYADNDNPPCMESGGAARCHAFSVEIPLDAEIHDVKAFARELHASGWPACDWAQSAGRQYRCHIGWSEFVTPYTVDATPQNKRVLWTFKNWKHDRYREARVAVTWSRAAQK